MDIMKVAKCFNLHVYYDKLSFPPHNNNIHNNGNEVIHMIEKDYYAKVFALHLISLLGYDIFIQNVDIIWLRQFPLTFFQKKRRHSTNSTVLSYYDIYMQEDYDDDRMTSTNDNANRRSYYNVSSGFY